jgi:hypothetical protein
MLYAVYSIEKQQIYERRIAAMLTIQQEPRYEDLKSKSKEVVKMKKLISFVTVMGFVLVFGTAYGSEAGSLINTLDPSKVPGFVELETGAVTLLAAKAQFTVQGSAAGGMRGEPDTFLNYIDPSRLPDYVNLETGTGNAAPKAFSTRGSAAGGLRMEPDTTVPGYIFIN